MNVITLRVRSKDPQAGTILTSVIGSVPNFGYYVVKKIGDGVYVASVFGPFTSLDTQRVEMVLKQNGFEILTQKEESDG